MRQTSLLLPVAFNMSTARNTPLTWQHAVVALLSLTKSQVKLLTLIASLWIPNDDQPLIVISWLTRVFLKTHTHTVLKQRHAVDYLLSWIPACHDEQRLCSSAPLSPYMDTPAPSGSPARKLNRVSQEVTGEFIAGLMHRIGICEKASVFLRAKFCIEMKWNWSLPFYWKM